MKRTALVMAAAVLFAAAQGCTHHTIESRHEVELKPVEVKPIHITIDVNVRVDRALDDFFDDIDQAQQGSAPAGDQQ